MKKIIALLIPVCAFLALDGYAQRRTAVNTANVPTPVVPVVYDSARPRMKGELIRPIKVWKDGQSLDAESIDCDIVYDDLNGSAKVLFNLKDSSGASLASGNITIDGQDYRTFNTAANRTNWTYNYVIRALRLQNRQTPVN